MGWDPNWVTTRRLWVGDPDCTKSPLQIYVWHNCVLFVLALIQHSLLLQAGLWLNRWTQVNKKRKFNPTGRHTLWWLRPRWCPWEIYNNNNNSSSFPRSTSSSSTDWSDQSVHQWIVSRFWSSNCLLPLKYWLTDVLLYRWQIWLLWLHIVLFLPIDGVLCMFV